MHFIATLWVENELWAYYIKGYQVGGEAKFAVGLATSTDGVSFADRGIVLDIGGAWQWVYASASDFFHQIGRADADGWSASTGQDPPNRFLCFGPYTTQIAGGPNTASFRLMIDNNTADNLPVVSLDIYDATGGQILAQRTINRREFSDTFSYQIFNLNFTSVAGHQLEFRTWWHGVAYVRQITVAISQGQAPWFDQRIASFPGVWRDNGVVYLAYEAAGDATFPGDIGLATSSDGVHFIKNGLILRHGGGWESANIGTPSLWKEGNTWYLFYHGFNGSQCQIGVATGSDLMALTKYPFNPILPSGPSGSWDEGTLGKRGIVQQDGVYYMIYEGSTPQPYHLAHWSSGVARSSNLLNWEKYGANPVIPQTSSGFGYDGPEFVILDGGVWVYYRHPFGPTGRAGLTF